MIGFHSVIPRPIYRWKTFGLVLLILAFLGWSWARSMRHSDSFTIQAARIYLSIDSDLGSLSIEYTTPDFTPRQTSAGASFRTDPRTIVWRDGVAHPVESASWFAPPFRHLGVIGGDSMGQMFIIAYWFLILLFLLPAAALLAWRHHRMKLRTARTIDAPALSSIP